MEWADTHPWEITKRRRPRQRFEASMVGLVLACVYLILEPRPVEQRRHEAASRLAQATGLPQPSEPAEPTP